MTAGTNHHFVPGLGLVRKVRPAQGDADVFLGAKQVASIWDTDRSRPNILFIDTGRVTEAESRTTMAALQPEYENKLAWVANPAKW